MFNFCLRSLYILNILAFSITYQSASACSSSPFVIELGNQSSYTVETNLFAPIVILNKGTNVEVQSILGTNNVDLSQNVRVEHFATFQESLAKKRIKPLKKWDSLLSQNATYLLPVTRKYTPLDFYELTPLQITFKNSLVEQALTLKLIINKRSLETAGTCKFSPKFVGEK